MQGNSPDEEHVDEHGECRHEIERLRAALSVFAKTSMSEIRPARSEYHIGWQDVDGQYGVKRSDIDAAMKVARSLQPPT